MVDDIIFLQVIYASAVLLGVFLYNYAGFLKFGKPNGERYDFTKLLRTLVTGGIMPVLASVLLFAQDGFQLFNLITAFSTGIAFSAGVDQLANIAEKPTLNTLKSEGDPHEV